MIQSGDETDYRRRVDDLVVWCAKNNLLLNVSKTKEMVVDFRRKKTPTPPLFIDGVEVERVDSFKFLGIHISSDLTWGVHVSHLQKTAQQRLFFLRRLRGFGLDTVVLVRFYRAVIESILTLSITVWYGNAALSDRDSLDKVRRTASKIIGTDLPSLDSIYEQRLMKKARAIIRDDSHPGHCFFRLLPSGQRYRSLGAKSQRLLNSTYPQAVRIMNSVLER